jgi:hypothetical protein
VPEASCPITSGGMRRPDDPSNPWTSLPQIPHASTRTRTSCSPGSGLGRSAMASFPYSSSNSDFMNAYVRSWRSANAEWLPHDSSALQASTSGRPPGIQKHLKHDGPPHRRAMAPSQNPGLVHRDAERGGCGRASCIVAGARDREGITPRSCGSLCNRDRRRARG